MNATPTRRPLFGVGASIAIAFVLVVPVIVHKATDSEPFPAVILPGSPSMAHLVDDATSFRSLTLIGLDEDGTEVTLDPREFHDPIPVQFLGVLAGESYGQAHNDKHVRIKLVDVVVEIDGHHASEAQQRAAREWMAERLLDLGLTDDRLIIRHDLVTVDLQSGHETSRELLDESVIELD